MRSSALGLLCGLVLLLLVVGSSTSSLPRVQSCSLARTTATWAASSCRAFIHCGMAYRGGCLSTAPSFRGGPHMLRSGAAASANPLRAGGPPLARQFAKLLNLPVAQPAVMLRIPLLA